MKIAKNVAFIYASATGLSFTLGNDVSKHILHATATLLSGTFTMPQAPVHGQEVSLIADQAVSSLLHQANTGQTLIGALTALVQNVLGGRWVFFGPTNTWYPD